MILETIAKVFDNPKRFYNLFLAKCCSAIAYLRTKDYDGTNINSYLDSLDDQAKWRERARHFYKKAQQ